jgi:hypothetical protein
LKCNYPAFAPQQQDFVHRIKHLAALARVRQLPEMIKKNDRFGFRPISSETSSIAILRGSNQRITTDSALYQGNRVKKCGVCVTLLQGIVPEAGLQDHRRFPER